MAEDTRDHFHDKVASVLGICTETFGEDLFYTPKLTGRAVQLRAIFDENFIQLDPNSDALVATNQPAIGVRLSDLPDVPREGDKLRRYYLGKTTEWKVVDAQEDGQGGARLVLHRVSP